MCEGGEGRGGCIVQEFSFALDSEGHIIDFEQLCLPLGQGM